MDDVTIEGRLATVEGRAKSNTHRIDKLDNVVDNIHKLSLNIATLVQSLDIMNDNIKELKEKVDTIEKLPANNWMDSMKTARGTVITVLVTAVVLMLVKLL